MKKVNFTDETDSKYSTVNNYTLDSVFVATSYLIGSESVFVYDSLEVERSDTLIHYDNIKGSYSYLEIPLEISYTIIKSKKFTVNVMTGITTSILLKKQDQLMNKDGIVEDITNASVNTFFSLQTGVNGGYQLVENMTIWANFTYIKGIQPMYSKNHFPLQKVDFIGIGTGVSYKF